jgi:hypothetical protein
LVAGLAPATFIIKAAWPTTFKLNLGKEIILESFYFLQDWFGYTIGWAGWNR